METSGSGTGSRSSFSSSMSGLCLKLNQGCAPYSHLVAIRYYDVFYMKNCKTNIWVVDGKVRELDCIRSATRNVLLEESLLYWFLLDCPVSVPVPSKKKDIKNKKNKEACRFGVLRLHRQGTTYVGAVVAS